MFLSLLLNCMIFSLITIFLPISSDATIASTNSFEMRDAFFCVVVPRHLKCETIPCSVHFSNRSLSSHRIV